MLKLNNDHCANLTRLNNGQQSPFGHIIIKKSDIKNIFHACRHHQKEYGRELVAFKLLDEELTSIVLLGVYLYRKYLHFF